MTYRGVWKTQIRPTAFPAAAVDTEGSAPAEAVSPEELSAAQVQPLSKAVSLRWHAGWQSGAWELLTERDDASAHGA